MHVHQNTLRMPVSTLTMAWPQAMSTNAEPLLEVSLSTRSHSASWHCRTGALRGAKSSPAVHKQARQQTQPCTAHVGEHAAAARHWSWVEHHAQQHLGGLLLLPAPLLTLLFLGLLEARRSGRVNDHGFPQQVADSLARLRAHLQPLSDGWRVEVGLLAQRVVVAQALSPAASQNISQGRCPGTT